jgi:hypothetical protein
MLISSSILVFLLSLDMWSIGYVIVFLAVGSAFELARNGATLSARLISMAVLAWFAIAVAINVIAKTVYVIRGADVSHMLLIGTVSYTLSNGTTVSVSDAYGGNAVVVNDSLNSVGLRTIHYGSSSSSATRPSPGTNVVGAYSVGSIDHRPDHFGPYDHPPSTVKVRGHGSSAWRYWLTW